ncbi:MAG: hypothetical protein RI601_11715 [Desulfurivibrionaceae bacterium]|nr:hypothetical protein [Desulfurivibrionaceae bacterium]
MFFSRPGGAPKALLTLLVRLGKERLGVRGNQARTSDPLPARTGVMRPATLSTLMPPCTATS